MKLLVLASSFLISGSLMAATFSVSCKKAPNGNQGASVASASGKLTISTHPTMPQYKMLKGTLKISASKAGRMVINKKNYKVAGILSTQNINGVNYKIASLGPETQPNKLQSVSVWKGTQGSVIYNGEAYLMICK
jgi:hypothetical protein